MFDSPTKRSLLRMMERERQSFALERARLIEQICHLSGKPWTVAPARMPVVEPEPIDELALIPDPDQFPAY